MLFTKRLRAGVRRGEITCSVRIWQRPHVKVGNRYPMEAGQIEIDAIEPIEMSDITAELARRSGFNGVVDLLKTAKHGPGTNVYLVRFHYLASQLSTPSRKKAALPVPQKKPNGDRQRARVAKIVQGLPEGAANPVGQHLSLEVRKKRFGWFMVDHHGDGRVDLNCKATADLHDALQRLAPAQFHVPKYVGNKGWVGQWLDVPGVDWSVVELALRGAYERVAPKTLVARLR